MALQVIHKEISFNIGDTVRVHQRITEITPKGERVRLQPFEGIVISTKGSMENKSFTVRRLATGGIGVERIYQIGSPLIEKVDVVAKGAVRRAKLYYLRNKSPREVAEITKRYTRRKTARAASEKRVKRKRVAVKKPVSATK